ncbi:hypothetical protein ACR9E3_19210 [Actinomycetospora sp. C-140]
MTAATDPTPTPRPARQAPPAQPDGYTVHRDADAPTTLSAAPAPAGPVATARRQVSLWLASVIAIVAFLVGLGVSMLVGQLGGPPDGGAGGPGGTPPGASTSQSTDTGAAQGT